MLDLEASCFEEDTHITLVLYWPKFVFNLSQQGSLVLCQELWSDKGIMEVHPGVLDSGMSWLLEMLSLLWLVFV